MDSKNRKFAHKAIKNLKNATIFSPFLLKDEKELNQETIKEAIEKHKMDNKHLDLNEETLKKLNTTLDILSMIPDYLENDIWRDVSYLDNTKLNYLSKQINSILDGTDEKILLFSNSNETLACLNHFLYFHNFKFLEYRIFFFFNSFFIIYNF